MVGNFSLTSLKVSNNSIDVGEAFDTAKAEMNRSRKFYIDAQFNAEYLKSDETRNMIRSILRNYQKDHPEESLNELVSEVIAGLERGYKLSGSFTNNNGVPNFTPSNESVSFSEYGFYSFNYNSSNDTLTIKGRKYNITSEFVFTKNK
jgi:hypothetical protein